MIKPCQTLQKESTQRKGEKNKKQPKRRGRPQGGQGTNKNRTLHQLHEAYELKRGEVNLAKKLCSTSYFQGLGRFGQFYVPLC